MVGVQPYFHWQASTESESLISGPAPAAMMSPPLADRAASLRPGSSPARRLLRRRAPGRASTEVVTAGEADGDGRRVCGGWESLRVLGSTQASHGDHDARPAPSRRFTGRPGPPARGPVLLVRHGTDSMILFIAVTVRLRVLGAARSESAASTNESHSEATISTPTSCDPESCDPGRARAAASESVAAARLVAAQRQRHEYPPSPSRH